MRKGLCEICSPKQWKTISTDLLTGTGYPVYGANGVIGYYSEYNHTDPTLLITCRGATCGMLNICKPYSYVNGNAMALDNLTPDVNILYLYYYLQNRGFKDVITGSAQPQIVRQSLEKVQIYYPDLQIQTAIVSLLDKVSDLIYLRKQQLAKLDELVKSRFVEMFGDPVTNPHGFEKVTLSDLAEIKIGPFGSLLHKEDYIEGGHALVNPSHIIDGKVSVDEKLTVSDDKFAELSAYHLQIGDVVMGRRGEMGRCAVVSYDGLLCGTGSLLIRTKGEVTADYIQKIISFPSFKKTIEDMAVGQTMPNLNVPIVSGFQIIKPPMEVQSAYYKFVEQLDKSKLAVQQSLDKLELLKKALMQKYFG